MNTLKQSDVISQKLKALESQVYTERYPAVALRELKDDYQSVCRDAIVALFEFENGFTVSLEGLHGRDEYFVPTLLLNTISKLKKLCSAVGSGTEAERMSKKIGYLYQALDAYNERCTGCKNPN